MSTVLTNGIIIPDNGSRNWGGDLANNWNILDLNVGYMTDVKNKVTTLENSTAENTSNIQINASNISALQTSKQDVIEDLETIRTGASAGATAVQPSTLSNYVDLSSEQTISGAKTFSSIIVGNLAGNADTATNAVNGVDSYGDSWMRFKNGIQICWGTIDVSANSLTNYDPATETYYNRFYVYNYAVAFSEEPSLNLSIVTGETSPFLMVTCESVGSDADRKTGTGNLILFSKNKNGTPLQIPTYICVFAVGRWN